MRPPFDWAEPDFGQSKRPTSTSDHTASAENRTNSANDVPPLTNDISESQPTSNDCSSISAGTDIELTSSYLATPPIHNGAVRPPPPLSHLLSRNLQRRQGGLLDSPVNMTFPELNPHIPLSPPLTAPLRLALLPNGLQLPESGHVSQVGDTQPVDEEEQSHGEQRKTTLSNEDEDSLQDLLGPTNLLPLSSPISPLSPHGLSRSSALLSTSDNLVSSSSSSSTHADVPLTINQSRPEGTVPVDEDTYLWLRDNSRSARLYPTPQSSIDDEDVHLYSPPPPSPPTHTEWNQSPPPVIQKTTPEGLVIHLPVSSNLFTEDKTYCFPSPVSIHDFQPREEDLLPSIFDDEILPARSDPHSPARRNTNPEFLGFDDIDTSPMSPSRRTFSPLPDWTMEVDDVPMSSVTPSPSQHTIDLPDDLESSTEASMDEPYPPPPPSNSLLFIDDIRDLPNSPSPEDYDLDLPMEDEDVETDPNSDLAKLRNLRRRALSVERNAYNIERSLENSNAVYERSEARKVRKQEREKAREIGAMLKVLNEPGDMSRLAARMMFRRRQVEKQGPRRLGYSTVPGIVHARSPLSIERDAVL